MDEKPLTFEEALAEVNSWFDVGVQRPAPEILYQIAKAWKDKEVGPQRPVRSLYGVFYQRRVTSGEELIDILNTMRPLSDAEARSSVGTSFYLWAWNKFKVRFSSLD